MFSKEEQALELIKRASAPVDGEGIDSIEKLFEAFRVLGEQQSEKLLGCITEYYKDPSKIIASTPCFACSLSSAMPDSVVPYPCIVFSIYRVNNLFEQ